MLRGASSGAETDRHRRFGVDGDSGGSGAVAENGADAPAWWEGAGAEVMTLVIPTNQKDFAPEQPPGQLPP